MMNRKTVLSAACALLVLAGCSDASASIKDKSETVMTVGNTTVTKGDVYDMLVLSIGADEVYNDAFRYISENEIEVTDEMKENAKSTLELYSTMYGDSFTSYLESSGLTEDDYLNRFLIPSLQQEKLVGTYIDEHFDEVASQYNPIKVIVLSFTSEDDASAALSALKDGSLTAAEAASQNNSSSTGTEEIVTINTTTYDTAALSVMRSASPDEGWIEVPSSDGATFYVLKVVSNDPQDYKEETITTLSNIAAITSASTDYFFRKYGFHVYDISIYNALKDSYPELLVQDTAAPTPAPTAETAETTEEVG